MLMGAPVILSSPGVHFMSQSKNDDFYNFDVFVVGNGFDKAYGYPTSYEDFYSAIKLVHDNANSFDQFKIAFKNGKNDSVTEKFYSATRKRLANNFYIQYILWSERVFKRWSDFEKELWKILHSFDYFLSKINADNNASYYEVPIRNSVKTYKIFANDFLPEWRGFSFKTHDDFCTGTLVDKNYQGKYDSLSLNNRIEEIREIIIKGLFEDLSAFKEIFKLYLNTVVFPKETYVDNIAFNNVVTFNYTNTIENNNLAKDVFHIHGNLNSDIVLGVDSTKPLSLIVLLTNLQRNRKAAV